MASQPNFALFDQTTLHDILNEKRSEEKIYSVSEFVDYVNGMFQPLEFVIQGEVSRVDERGMAVYFTLCDKDEKAVLNCLIWKSKLNSYGITLKDGLEVKVTGSANIYKPIGKFTFMTDYITPIGDGALNQAFEQLKRKLQLAGYFDASRKRHIPSYVNTVGLITSDSADAKKDFLTHLGSHGIQIQFYDVRVEGIKAESTIVKAIRWFNENSHNVEVLVLTRGGGSLESLQAFNSEPVAKAIYSSKIPIISAVGHENDVTIADLIADYRASTPTHAGKYLAENWNTAEMTVDEVEQNIHSIFRKSCRDAHEKIRFLERSFISCYKQSLDSNFYHIETLDKSLSLYFQNMFSHFKHIVERYRNNFNQYLNAYSENKNKLRTSELYFHDFTSRWYKHLHKCVAEHERTLISSDPELKLKQGYSITLDNQGRIVRSAQSLTKDDIISVKLHSGQLEAVIETII